MVNNPATNQQTNNLPYNTNLFFVNTLADEIEQSTVWRQTAKDESRAQQQPFACGTLHSLLRGKIELGVKKENYACVFAR